jgi:hypothetical protein
MLTINNDYVYEISRRKKQELLEKMKRWVMLNNEISNSEIEVFLCG